MAATGLPALAARRHTTVATLVTTDAATMLQIGFLAVALIGYAMATARRELGWHLAAVGVIVATLRSALLGKWSSLVNPIHSLAAALWIGTLFVLVVAGLSALLVHEPTRARRGAIAADMVNGFSPLALSMGGVVVLFGLITAWRHLHQPLEPVVDALRRGADREARLRRVRVRARRVELAPAAADARHRIRGGLDTALGDRSSFRSPRSCSSSRRSS